MKLINELNFPEDQFLIKSLSNDRCKKKLWLIFSEIANNHEGSFNLIWFYHRTTKNQREQNRLKNVLYKIRIEFTLFISSLCFFICSNLVHQIRYSSRYHSRLQHQLISHHHQQQIIYAILIF